MTNLYMNYELTRPGEPEDGECLNVNCTHPFCLKHSEESLWLPTQITKTIQPFKYSNPEITRDITLDLERYETERTN